MNVIDQMERHRASVITNAKRDYLSILRRQDNPQVDDAVRLAVIAEQLEKSIPEIKADAIAATTEARLSADVDRALAEMQKYAVAVQEADAATPPTIDNSLPPGRRLEALGVAQLAASQHIGQIQRAAATAEITHREQVKRLKQYRDQHYTLFVGENR